MNKKIIPQPISKNDTIGIAAPASHFQMEKFEKGIKILESMGFNVLVPDEIFLKDDYCAGTDECRAGIVQDLFNNPEVKAIICVRGGFGSIRALPFFQFDEIKKKPKRFFGFSDITSLLCNFYQKSEMVTFHGPVITQLADENEETIQFLYKMLTTNEFDIIYSHDTDVLCPGIVEGPIIGGNLTTLCHLVGTPFEPDLNNHILFIEDIGEAAYKIDRMLTQMKLAGCFKKIRGLLLGTFTDCGDEEMIFNIIKRIFKDQIPVLTGLNFGHGEINQCIPIGVHAKLDTYTKSVEFLTL